ncbi:MAG TPA: VWA domain-containing protein [Planctomycetota bacterium]|nr:VWA domain-containing protein [Planctomycetota bacterium]
MTWSLLDPWLLLLVVPLALVVVLRLRRPRAALPAAALLDPDLPRSLRARLVHLPFALQVLGGLAFVVAIARPVVREVLPIREQGVDILLVLDRSSSMLAPDMDARGKTRMVAARENAIAFAGARTDDRLGLLTFARYPELTCPPTLDQQALQAFVRGVETVRPRSPEDGTAIGVALAEASRVLAGSDAKSKVAVLLSDGEENPDVPIDYEQGAKLCKDAGVRVHTIGVGTLQQTLLGPVEPDFVALRKVAEITEGKFFRARSADDLAEVYAEIDRLEKVELEDPRYRTADHFAWPLFAGSVLLALAWLLEWTWLRRVP